MSSITVIRRQIPNDIPEKDKAEALDWLISQVIKAQKIPDVYSGFLNVKQDLEFFYLIKNSGQSRFLSVKSLMKVAQWDELEDIVDDAQPKYEEWDNEKQEKELAKNGGGEGVNHIVKDNPDWDVYIPETQLAARFLGRGTNWCTATNPKTSRNYYDQYHTEESPLYIFISKANPTDKYQFSYAKHDFANKSNKQAKRPKFLELNEIIKNIGEPIITSFNLNKANKYVFKKLKNGGYSYFVGNVKKWYLKGDLHREDGPAFIDSDGSQFWYLKGKLHRENGPAVEYQNGEKEWYLKGKRHNRNGPAIEYVHGGKKWFINGMQYTESGFNLKECKGSKNMKRQEPKELNESSSMIGMTIREGYELLKSFEGKNLIFFDTETTGLHPKNSQITEVAVFVGHLPSWSEGINESSFIKFHEKAKLTQQSLGKLKEKMYGDKTYRELLRMTNYGQHGKKYLLEGVMLKDLKDFIEQFEDPVYVAQNAQFDMKMINTRLASYGLEPLNRAPVLDTKSILSFFLKPIFMTSKKNTRTYDVSTRVPEKRGSMSTSLGDIAAAFEISNDNWHSADADVLMMINVLQQAVKIFELEEYDIEQANQLASGEQKSYVDKGNRHYVN